MNKKGVFPYIAILLVLSLGAVGVLIATNNISLGAINYDYVYKANYGHLCCIAGPLETLAGPRYADDITSTSCSENVDECTLYFKASAWPSALTFGTIDVDYNECDLDGSDCVKKTYKLGKNDDLQKVLPVGKKATFLKSGVIYDYRKYYTWERKGSVYDLVGQENGKIFVSDGCSLSNSLKGQVLSGIPNNIPKGYDNCVNYFTDFIQTATQTYRYSGQDVVCQARAVYRIDETTMKDGSVIRLQGSKIADVDCCPSESNCGSDFKFKSNVVKECTYDYQCDNGGDLFGISQTTAGYFVCQDGQCVKKTKSVECTSDAVCQTRYGEGYICSFAEATWGTCIEAPTGPYCGDGYCDIGESKSTCIEDCELECMEGEKLVTTEKKVDCIVGWPLNIGCDTEVSKECRPAKSTNWVLWILLGVAFLLLLTQWRKILMFFKVVFHI